MSGPTPCWSTKQICIKIHVPSLSCPSTGIYIYIYISTWIFEKVAPEDLPIFTATTLKLSFFLLPSA